jgi:hypothetical protein
VRPSAGRDCRTRPGRQPRRRGNVRTGLVPISAAGWCTRPAQIDEPNRRLASTDRRRYPFTRRRSGVESRNSALPAARDLGAPRLGSRRRLDAEAADESRELVEVDLREVVAVAATGRSRGNESRLAQLAEVVRDERLAHPRHLLELTHRTGATRKPERDQQSFFIRKRAQDRRPGNRDRSALIGYGLDSSIEGSRASSSSGASPATASTPTTPKPAPESRRAQLLPAGALHHRRSARSTAHKPRATAELGRNRTRDRQHHPDADFGRARKRLGNQLQYAATEQGDAFYEPANVAIAHFDNASDHDSAAFVACYLLPPGEARLIEMLSSPTTG